MSKKLDTIWPLPKHTEAKHKLLRAYFGAWIAILSQKFRRVAFVDGFCGPGQYTGGELGSPTIVIDEAQKALAAPHLRPLSGFSANLWFSDEDNARIEHLKSVLSARPRGDERVIVHAPIEGLFEQTIETILTALNTHSGQVPLFVFIDPFGAKGFSMATIEKILKREGAEVFLLFDVDGMDRNLMAWDEPNKRILCDVFGLAEAEFEPIRAGVDQKKRILLLRQRYSKCLRDRRLVRGILPFCMYDGNNRPLHDMIFLTNNELGFVKMKESMWKADATGEFRFSEADIDQLGLPLESVEQRLWRRLSQEFSGKTIPGAKVRNFVELRTLFLNKHKTTTLTLHESDQVPAEERIVVTRQNARGRRGYSDSASVTFPALQTK
jgi:three-Cys-motif partner protein